MDSSRELGLYQVTDYRAEDDVRVLDLSFQSESLLAAVFADSTIAIFSITGNQMKRLALIDPPDFSLFTKV